MSQRFNVPPGWPVPSGWTPPEGWEPDPSWPPAPAGWQFWVEDLPGPTQASTVTENRSADATGKRLVILGTVGAVVLIALAGGVAIFLHGRGTTAGQSGSDGHWTETSKTLPAPAPAPAPVVLPAGAVECGVSAGGTYRGAAKGTDSTSCPFVENVRDAFNNAGGQVPTVVEAYSPVTGKHYQMSCAMEQVITCRGGVNAVVYVYEKAGATGAPAASAPATNALPSDAMIFEALKQSGVSAHDLAQYAIVSKSAPTSGWYVAEIRRTDMQLEHAYAIFRDNSPPDGHLKWVAGPGTSFPSQYFSFPDEVRQVLPSGYS